MTILDHSHQPGILVNHVLYGEYDSIVQRWHGFLGETAHVHPNFSHLLQSSGSIADAHVGEARGNTALGNKCTIAVQGSAVKLEWVSRSVGNVHNVASQSLRLFQ